MAVGLETVDTYRVVERVETLSHGVTVRRYDQLTILIAVTYTVQAQVLTIGLFSSFILVFMEPDALFDDVIFNFLTLCCCADTTREHVNIPEDA